MRQSNVLTLTLILTMIFSCESDRKFPEVKSLSEYKQTSFLPTLEHELPGNKFSLLRNPFICLG